MTKSLRSDWRPAKKEKPPTGPGGENEFGLDHNESRSWHGWHRHVSLVMLAFAMMAAIRHRANRPAPPRGGRAGSLFRVGAPPKVSLQPERIHGREGGFAGGHRNFDEL
jgi:hypothetical protein